MAEESLITDEARAMIGRQSGPITGYAVSEHEIRRYCHAVDDLNPLYLDQGEADKSIPGGIIAPPLFYSIPFATSPPLSEIREDGLPMARPGLPKVPLKVTRTMFGGIEVEFVRPVRLGDILTSQTKITDMYERKGRGGTNMVFIIRETIVTNQKGETVAIERATGITR